MGLFDYTHALVRHVPLSFSNALSMEVPEEPIDVALAKSQKAAYNDALRKVFRENLIEIQADESCPDCCFIEDTCVIINNTAVITHMRAPSRTPEVNAIAEELRKLPGVNILTMPPDGPAYLDGGDVLVTEKHIFVGSSQRSNKEGAEFLQQAFPSHQVITIPVNSGLHLKSVLSLLDHNLIVVADTQQGREIAAEIAKAGNYEFLYVPDVVASNVLRFRSTLFVQSGFPESEKLLKAAAQQRGLEVVALKMSEFIKADGALTCCSVFLTLPPS